MVGFEKALGAVKVIKDQIQYRSQSLLNLARGYFRNVSSIKDLTVDQFIDLIHNNFFRCISMPVSFT